MTHRLAILAATAAALAACDAHPAAPAATEILVRELPSLPAAPGDAAWKDAPVFEAALRPQDMVEPRKMEGLLSTIRVRAATDGRRIAFRLDWADGSEDTVRIPARFADACAVQLPAVTAPDLPAPQMGEKGKPVRIAYWSAAAQASVDGRGDGLKDFYPNAQVDHYPFEAPGLEKTPDAQARMRLAYAPARAVGNDAGRPKRAVQDLVATGPGSLAPAPAQEADGRGQRTDTGWAVVITRPLPEGLSPGARTHASFAVWNGVEGDAGSRKRWVPWTPVVRPAPVAAR